MSDLLRSLRLFRDLNELGSFSALARQKNLSHTTVARAIDDLEAHFGLRLFHRSTRSLNLTSDGERLMEHVALILEQVDQAETELAGASAVKGVVRIGVTTALGLYYAERLSTLRDPHPQLSIELLVADWRDVTVDSGLDLWLTIGDNDRTSGSSLGQLPLVLVAAPAYLQRRGPLHSVHALSAHECLSYGYEARLTAWVIDGEELRPSGFLRANSSEAVHRAARGGLGIALLPRIQVEDDLAAGSLVQVLPQTRITPLPISISRASSLRRVPLRVQVVADFITDHFPGCAAVGS